MVNNILEYICCGMFALSAVMIFNFVLARCCSKIAKTDEQELLDNTLSYFSNTPPEVHLEREVHVSQDGRY